MGYRPPGNELSVVFTYRLQRSKNDFHNHQLFKLSDQFLPQHIDLPLDPCRLQDSVDQKPRLTWRVFSSSVIIHEIET